MRRIGASVLLGLVTSMVWIPAANAEETLPSETVSESPAAQDLPSLDIPTGSPSGASTDSPTASPTEPATSPPTEEPTEEPTGTPSDTPTDTPTGTPTESPSDTPSGSPTSPTQAPYTEPPTQAPAIAQRMTSAQAVALAAAVISPISMLTTVLFGAPYTPGSISAPSGALPTSTYAADDPTSSSSPSPSPSPTTTDDLTLSGSDTGTPVDDVRWGGLAIILLCAAAGLFGYRVARRGGPGTASHP